MKVFLNGNVITVDSKNNIHEAVAIKGNRIVGVGSNEQIKKMIIENETEVIDLKGRSLVPGFIDSHVHMVMHGTNQMTIDAKAPHIKKLSDLFEDIKKVADKTEKGKWVRVWGFNENEMEEKRFPTLQELNELSTEHPIFIMRTCGHHSIVNESALRIANISKETPNPIGGEIQKDKDGNLTGLLIETAHMLMGEIAKFSEEEKMNGMKLASDDYISHGITSIHEAGGHGAEDMRVMQRAIREGYSKVRIYIMLCELNNSGDYVKKMSKSGMITGLGNEKIKVGPVKLFTDGASIAPTMATRDPYLTNKDDCGILFYKKEEVYEIFEEAHKKGFQITAHAQGDRAIELMLECYEEILKKYPRENHRHRIEHAGLSMPDLVKRMSNLGVIPIPNPNFIYEHGESYLKHVGDRVDSMYPVRDLVDAGIIVAGASDNPVTTCNPLVGIHGAVNRKTKDDNNVGESQQISVLEAIRLYTWNGAYASFEEDQKGSIEVGKLADLTILGTNILTTPKEELKNIKVEMTIIDGEIVFNNTNR